MAFAISSQCFKNSTCAFSRDVMRFGFVRIDSTLTTACKLEATSYKKRNTAPEWSETLCKGVFVHSRLEIVERGPGFYAKLQCGPDWWHLFQSVHCQSTRTKYTAKIRNWMDCRGAFFVIAVGEKGLGFCSGGFFHNCKNYLEEGKDEQNVRRCW